MSGGAYGAPFGYAARPFHPGGTFPGAPSFATPSPLGSLGSLGFPIGNGPGAQGGQGITGFAPGVQRPNRVQDFGTNGQVAYHYVVTPDKNSEASQHRINRLGLGMLVFARDMSLDALSDPGSNLKLIGNRSLSTVKPYYGPGERTERTVEAFELTQLNAYLKETVGNASFEDSNKKQHNVRVSDMYRSARQLVEAFPMLGVILTEVAPSNDVDYGKRASTRVINFVVRGRCQTFNLWTGKRPASTPVYLLAKKRFDDNAQRHLWCFEPFPGQGGPHMPSNEEYHVARPAPEDLCWQEDDGTIGVGEAVYVGMLGSNVGDVSLESDKEMWRQGLFVEGKMPPTTELFLRI